MCKPWAGVSLNNKSLKLQARGHKDTVEDEDEKDARFALHSKLSAWNTPAFDGQSMPRALCLNSHGLD